MDRLITTVTNSTVLIIADRVSWRDRLRVTDAGHDALVDRSAADAVDDDVVAAVFHSSPMVSMALPGREGCAAAVPA